jgi:hypothetical protein
VIALSLGATRVDEALRAMRALGAHRYVAGRMHLVHAFALAAAPAGEALAQAGAWARATLADPGIDATSRDEALWRRCSDAELVALLDVFWTPAERARAARDQLVELLARHDLTPQDHAPFDEAREDDMHPLVIDAGWELLALAELDPVHHKGAIAAFGEALSFESARFEEETAIPSTTHVYELPAIGPVELLRGADGDGMLAEPLVVWAEGDETYLDYVVRGVRRAAKLPERDDD